MLDGHKVCASTANAADMMFCLARTEEEQSRHGGIGFTAEWFKRIGCNRQLLGGPERVREEAAQHQNWSRTA